MMYKIFITRFWLAKIDNRILTKFFKTSYRFCSEDIVSSGASPITTPIHAHFHHYMSLELPSNKILATYVWIDGSGINLRSKDRVLDKVPCNLSMVPTWTFDGSSTGLAETKNSDIDLVPVAVYKDPIRKTPHIIVLCETYDNENKPTKTNYRVNCANILNQISDQDPWFGIEQEYTMFDIDMWPLGWPKIRGIPVTQSQYSYCGMGSHVAGREIVESHARSCIYAGIDYTGSNAETMKSSWEFQVGATKGIRAADDLWVGRYLLSRIGEQFGVIISFHPKLMGPNQPGIGCHHNFSVKKMRQEGGLSEIERVCKVLCDKNDMFMKHYGLKDGFENKKRLTGDFETGSFNDCKWGVADRSASIRLQKSVMTMKKGYLEDRRPAGDCDPYRVCALLAETCLSYSLRYGCKIVPFIVYRHVATFLQQFRTRRIQW